MSHTRSRLGIAAVAVVAASALVVPHASATTAPGLVTDVASTRAPTVPGQQCYPSAGPPELCRQVLTIVKSGNWIYVGGQVDQVWSPLTRKFTTGVSNLFRFDARTQALDTSFRPQFFRTPGRVDNGAVMGLAPSSDGQSLYVSGAFTEARGSTNGVTYDRPGVVKISTTTGDVDPTFDARVCAGGGSCEVDDVALIGSTLWLGGAFSRVGGLARPALTGVSASTGALMAGGRVRVAGRTQAAVAMRVHKVVPNPTHTKMVIIGNFGTVQGASRYSVALLQVDPATGAAVGVDRWNAPQNLAAAIPTCNKKMYWPRGAAWTPSGDAFALAAKGVGGGHPYPALCDAFSIFHDDSSADAVPFGYNHTEIDSVMSVCSLGDYVYVGGHYKSLNQEVRLSGKVVRPPVSQRNETHYGLGVINAAPTSMLAVSGWNQTTQTGRGAGWGAALCVDGPGSEGGGVYFGGDAKKVNGNASIQKLAYFPAAG